MINLRENKQLVPEPDLKLIALQLQKDFMMFGEEIEMLEVHSIGQLHQIMSDVVKELLVHNRTKLTQIIYRIDIPEKAISKALEENATEKVEQSISKLMIERTQLKIELRKIHG